MSDGTDQRLSMSLNPIGARILLGTGINSIIAPKLEMYVVFVDTVLRSVPANIIRVYRVCAILNPVS